MEYLTLLFIVPFVASIIAFLLPTQSARAIKSIAFVLSLIPLVLLLINHDHWLGSTVLHKWMPALSIDFHLQVDSLSLVFLYLTAFIIPISILAAGSRTISHPHTYYGLILLLQGLLIGFFTSRDLALFTVFWEAMLLPLYFIINIWGGEKRQHAAIKFLVYMIAGSALMVAAVLALYLTGNTFNMDILAKTAMQSQYAPWIFAAFLLAFAVKTPLFPFHAWLPDAYYEAPIGGTILLSALLSKAGIYGILRIGMEEFGTLLQHWGPILLGVAIVGVIYGALAAWAQKDYKRLIAYSSFSHVNFILAGLFVWNDYAHSGAILQAFNHGVTIAALFLVAGWLQKRMGTTSMNHISGLAKYFPHLCWLTLFFVLSNVALPGTNSFVGELLIMLGVFTYNPWWAALLGTAIILSVVYMLYWMQHVYFGPSSELEENKGDLRFKEALVALPLVALILWIGIYPTPFLKQTEAAAEKISASTQAERIS